MRHELKLVCDENGYAALRMALRLDPLGIRELHPPRLVQSVYLDTPFQRALEENRAGISRREKLRFRWYGAARDRGRGTLEHKVRENTLGWKESLELAEPIAIEGVERHAFVAALANAAHGLWRRRLEAGLEPAQWIAYRRDYLTSADRRVRLTIDRDLEAWDQRLLPRLSRARATALPRFLVLELKCAPAALDHARELVQRLPLKVDRCSKFALASDVDCGPHSSFLGR